jgi:hypothetical protein
LVHCRNEQEAQALKAELQARLAECHLEMHPTKTKIVYCKDGVRRGTPKKLSWARPPQPCDEHRARRFDLSWLRSFVHGGAAVIATEELRNSSD